MAQEARRKEQGIAAGSLGGRALLHQYHTIGGALLAFEEGQAAFLPKTGECEKNFREATVFVSVEVLESYLDDLMDLSVSDERLHIERPRTSRVLLTLVCVILAGLLAMPAGVLVVLCCIPAVLLVSGWYRSRSALMRRLSFARAVTKEVNRRRGRDEGPLVPIHAAFQWKHIFSPSEKIPGAAVQMWH